MRWKLINNCHIMRIGSRSWLHFYFWKMWGRSRCMRCLHGGIEWEKLKRDSSKIWKIKAILRSITWRNKSMNWRRKKVNWEITTKNYSRQSIKPLKLLKWWRESPRKGTCSQEPLYKNYLLANLCKRKTRNSMPSYTRLRRRQWTCWSFRGKNYDDANKMIDADTINDDNQTGW